MSLWKFNDFEAEVDFADADFIETLEEAQAQLEKDVLAVPTVGHPTRTGRLLR